MSHVSFNSFDVFKFIPLDTLLLQRPCSGWWHFVDGQYFTPSKAWCFGQITISLPSLSNKPTRASVSSLSEATHDCFVCSSLQCAFARIQGKICIRSGYLVDTSHSLVQCPAKEHENCDIVFNERSFHLYIVYLKLIGTAEENFEIFMHVHLLIESLWISTTFWCIWAIRSITYPKAEFNI